MDWLCDQVEAAAVGGYTDVTPPTSSPIERDPRRGVGVDTRGRRFRHGYGCDESGEQRALCVDPGCPRLSDTRYRVDDSGAT